MQSDSWPRQLDEYLALARSFVYTAAVALVGIAACFIVARDLWRPALTIEPISVPPRLVARGYTAELMRSRLADEVQNIYKKGKTERPPPGLEIPEDKRPDVQVPGIGLSVKSLVSVARDLFGISETKIQGEMTIENGHLRLWIRSNTGATSSVDSFVAGGQLDNIIKRGALEVVKLTTPHFAANYIYDQEANACIPNKKCAFPKTLAAIEYTLSKGQLEDRKWAEVLWGYLLQVSLHDNEQALTHYLNAGLHPVPWTPP